MDNARIHGAEETIETLHSILQVVGIQIVYLPVYSPELNSCELIFEQVKRYLREYRNSSIPL
jgi:transposase